MACVTPFRGWYGGVCTRVGSTVWEWAPRVYWKQMKANVNSPVLQNARPRAVALASYTEVDKIIKNTVGFTRKDIWNNYN